MAAYLFRNAVARLPAIENNERTNKESPRQNVSIVCFVGCFFFVVSTLRPNLNVCTVASRSILLLSCFSFESNLKTTAQALPFFSHRSAIAFCWAPARRSLCAAVSHLSNKSDAHETRTPALVDQGPPLPPSQSPHHLSICTTRSQSPPQPKPLFTCGPAPAGRPLACSPGASGTALP